jgi:glycosyltransferase involved in cell wall biosynthesis
MKILISLQNCFSFNTGVQKFIERYSSGLCGDQIHFVYRENLRRPYLIDGLEIKDIKKSLKELGIDLCHVHSIFDSDRYNGLIDIFKKLKIPIIYFYHSNVVEEVNPTKYIDELNQEKIIAQEELLKKSDKIICFNEYQKNKILDKNPGFKAKIEVLYHGTIDKSLKDKNCENKVILYVGRFSKEKGIFDLARAYKNISSKDIKLILVGAAEDKNTVKKIVSILDKKRYEIVDWVNDEKKLSKYYQKAYLVVIPSHYDSFNMVGIEALAHGKNILVSDIPVFQELYIKKGLAYKFKCKKISDLTNKIDYCSNNQLKYVKLPKEYLFENFIKRLEEINKSML